MDDIPYCGCELPRRDGGFHLCFIPVPPCVMWSVTLHDTAGESPRGYPPGVLEAPVSVPSWIYVVNYA